MRRVDFLRVGSILLVSLATGMTVLALGQEQQPLKVLVDQFKASKVFWQQIEIGKKIVAAHDRSVLPQIQPMLSDQDRHRRGNAAYVFAGLGDDRGFETIRGILTDRSNRPLGQGVVSVGPDSPLDAQIATDRYYAVHLLGDLKDSRALPIILPLLNDKEVNYIVPWSLGEIGEKAAVKPLIQTLDDPNPDMRVLAIYALEKLHATEALPAIQRLIHDQERIHFDGLIAVSEAAMEAESRLR
jgi:HEAT repeat protein